MSRATLMARLREVIQQSLPLPGGGQTALRHRQLMELGREDLSLARLAEAHWDAVAILAEAGHAAKPDAIYGVWAAEIPGEEVSLEALNEGVDSGFAITGSKPFCSGGGLVDYALVTVSSAERRLVEVDLREPGTAIQFDDSAWKTSAFADTKTVRTNFFQATVAVDGLIGGPGWYLSRPGFWHGACGPAACWAGGALGLVDWAVHQKRNDPHTVAHLGAMSASAWALQSLLEKAGDEIDANPANVEDGHRRALSLRHLVEETCADILRRFARAYGPHPLAMDAEMARRYQELELYIRQCHAERDLEALGRLVLTTT